MRYASEARRKREPSPSKLHGLPGRGYLKSRFAIAVDKFVSETSGAVFVGELDDIRAVPLDVDDRNEAVWEYPTNRGTTGQILKSSHRYSPTSRWGIWLKLRDNSPGASAQS